MKVALIVAIVGLALLLVTSFGLDQQSTIELTSLTYTIASVVAIVALLAAIRFAEVQSHPETGQLNLAHLRKTAPSRWAATIALFCLACAVVSWFMSVYLLSVAVPYLPGAIEHRAGRITKVFKAYGRGRRCDIYAVVSLNEAHDEQFCIVGGRPVRHRTSTSVPQPGQDVVVALLHTSFGVSIASVQPIN